MDLYLSLSLALSVCCLYYSRLMGTGEIVLGVNGAENGVVLVVMVGREGGGWEGGVD